jgi:hypothetical protein
MQDKNVNDVTVEILLWRILRTEARFRPSRLFLINPFAEHAHLYDASTKDQMPSITLPCRTEKKVFRHLDKLLQSNRLPVNLHRDK